MIIIANITIKSDKYSGLMFSCLIDIVGNLLARRIAIKKIYRYGTILYTIFTQLYTSLHKKRNATEDK